jgi:hypothetical protein
MTFQEIRKNKEYNEMVQGARHYAAADRTDPFAFSRAMSHVKNGVASYRRGDNQDYDISAGPAFYNATPFRDQRAVKIGDREVKVDSISYRNVTRP